MLSLLPRKSFVITCNLTEVEIHKKLSDHFNPASTQSGILPDKANDLSYSANSKQFIVKNVVTDTRGNKIPIVGTGTINPIELHNEIRKDYIVQSAFLKTFLWCYLGFAILLALLLMIAFINKLLNGIFDAKLLVAILTPVPFMMVPFVFKYMYVGLIYELHRKVANALK